MKMCKGDIMFGIQKKTDENGTVTREVTYQPAVDVTESDAGYVIHADVPGANKDSVQITFENGIVTLRAQGPASTEGAKAKAIHREFRLASYERSFRVGDDVDSDSISAEITHGVLKVTLPRKASAAKRSISIK